MNTPQSNIDYNLIVSHIKKLEEEQFCWKEDTIWLKHYLHLFKEEFNKRPEVEEINALKETISQLTTQIDELQQHINQSSKVTEQIDETIHQNLDQSVDSDLEDTDSIESIDSLMDLLDDDDDDYPIYRRTKNYSRTSKSQPSKEQNSIIASATGSANQIVSTCRISTSQISTSQTSSTVSDDDFKVERMMWILEKYYLDEEKIKSI